MKQTRRLIGVVLVLVVTGCPVLFTRTADAHRNGCHAAHSCPSDANPPTYRCGDTGHGCTSPNDPSNPNTPHLSGPPTASDCQNYPQYYDPSVCAGGAQRTPAPAGGGGSSGGNTTSACGVERWSVKTGADADRNAVSLTTSTKTTIAYLTSLARPSSLPSNNRIAPVETQQWTIDASLIEYKVEADSDVHLVLHDSAGRSMIAEIPSPSCVSTASPMRSLIASARSAFLARFAPVESWRYANAPITVTGPAFWDYEHGQTGVAPNAIEIHPVLLLGAPANPPAVGAAVVPGAAAPSPSVQIETPVPTEAPASRGLSPQAATKATPQPSAVATAGGFVVLLGLLGGAGYGIYRLVRHLRGRPATPS